MIPIGTALPYPNTTKSLVSGLWRKPPCTTLLIEWGLSFKSVLYDDVTVVAQPGARTPRVSRRRDPRKHADTDDPDVAVVK